MATFDINDVARRVQYTSTGQTGPFNFNFQVNASSELLVYIDDTEKTETTHYTVSLNADGTGSVTFTSATTTGELITIIGDQALSRTTVFSVGQVNNPTTLETEFDNTLIRQQQIKEITDRALQLKPTTPRTVTGSGTSGPLYWPYDATASNNANKVIKYDSAGTGLELGPTTTDISTIAGIASDVTTVSGIASDVTAVAADASDIGVVSSNIASVNTVATNINDVIAVANDLNEAVSEVETVANDLNEAVSEIDTVATSITNVDTVGNNISNVNTVAGISSNVTTVAGISANVTTVAGISSDVTAVAGDATDIGTVATDLAGTNTIGTVAGGIANVNTVATNIANVNTVAGNNSNITTVAGISGNVTTVAGIAANVTAVASDSTDIGTVATNIANVNTVAGISANVTTVAGISSDVTAVAADATDIGTVATNIANVNSVGGSIANVNTVASNISGVNSFAERYRVDSSDPSTSLDQGDLVYNTTANALKYYDGSTWQQIVAGGLTDIVQDGTPQLGGTLDANGNTIDMGVNIITDTKVGQWDTAYGWGDHSGQGYITASSTNTLTNKSGNISQWTNDSGYLTSYTTELSEDLTPQLGGDLDTNGNNINFGDNDKAVFGASSDLQIYHDGSHSIIADAGTGNLEFRGTHLVARNGGDTGNYFQALDGAQIELFYNGSKKFETTNSGITVTGAITTTDNIYIPDGDSLYLGDSLDLRLWHDGSNSYINDQGTGNLYIRGSDVVAIQSAVGENYAQFNNNGKVYLYYDNSVKLETNSGGIGVFGDCAASNFDLNDNAKLRMGTSDDFQLYHDGSNSYIMDAGTGGLDIRGHSNIWLRSYNTGETFLDCTTNAGVLIYYDGSKKLETTSSGIDVTGQVLADKAYIAEATLTDGATISWNMSTQSVAKVTLGGNRTLAAPTNGSTGQFCSLNVIQDGTGSRTLTWNAAFEFKDDTAPTLTTTGGKGDLFVFRYNGSKWLEVGRNLNISQS